MVMGRMHMEVTSTTQQDTTPLPGKPLKSSPSSVYISARFHAIML